MTPAVGGRWGTLDVAVHNAEVVVAPHHEAAVVLGVLQADPHHLHVLLHLPPTRAPAAPGQDSTLQGRTARSRAGQHAPEQDSSDWLCDASRLMPLRRRHHHTRVRGALGYSTFL